MAMPVNIVASGGMAVSNVPNAWPMSPVSASTIQATPVSVVYDGGVPVTFVNEDFSAYYESEAARLLFNEPEGMAFSATDDSMLIKDQRTKTNIFNGAPSSKISVASAANRWYFNSSGFLVAAGNTDFRRDFNPAIGGAAGYLNEESRANVVLQNRDLSNASWTKTNATAAKDQTGIDGVANSASSLLATAGNATCLQAITLGSSARFQTAFVKRLVGTGTVEMTMDNGSTWTAITLTAAWTRVSIPTQTLANPTVGFRIVTNGDKIAVDAVQNENGIFATSPILTTTGTVTRAVETITQLLSTIPFSSTVGTVIINVAQINPLVAGDRWLFQIDDTTANERFTLISGATTGRISAFVVDGGVSQASITINSPVFAPVTFAKSALAWQANDVMACMAGTLGTQDTSATMPTPTLIRYGRSTSGNNMNGWLKEFTYVPRRMSNAELQAATA